jgi:hypothetical protein
MYILPFVQKRGNAKVNVLWCFLSEGGKRLWKTDSESECDPKLIEQEYLQPNGFGGGSVVCVRENCLFYELTNPNFQDFYMWTESDAKEECWRPFFILGDTEDWCWMEEAQRINLGIPLAQIFKVINENASKV